MAAAVSPGPASVRSGGGELRALTGLRIVAAAWVVLFHFHFTALPGMAILVDATGPLITTGALGVDLFFVLSGFVIAYTYLDRLGPALRVGAATQFVWARARRLWPAYALVVNVFGLWIGARLYFGRDDQIAFQAVQPEVGLRAWVEQMFMVQLWDRPFFDGASWVGSTWSISAEWLAYLLFPVTALVFYRLRNLPRVALTLGALLLMAPIAWAYLRVGHPYFPWSWLVRILCGFGAGVLTLLVVRRIDPTARVRRAASRLATATAVFIGAGLCLGELLGPGRGGAVIVLFPVLVGALALADRGVAQFLSAPPMVYGGRISYSLYLVHIPIFEVYWLAMAYLPELHQPTLTAHLVGAGVLLATVPVAQLLYRMVENPCRHRPVSA
ncbi:acyltransferase family protein [Pseudonocardia hispaniensis]|uniref:Acyltransferase family protein n=1 Tax=Pseudonocardia hispaniensis TaxID=904933 RepID=A0ABW1J728_9PSEU